MSDLWKSFASAILLVTACSEGVITSSNTGNGGHGVTLTWQAPTNNNDGSALTDLAGYRLYQGTVSGGYGASQDLGVATCSTGRCSYDVPSLTPGTYYFAVTAYDTGGYESVLSNEASATVP